MADKTAALYTVPVLALDHGATWINGNGRRSPLGDEEFVAVLVNAVHGTMHCACKQTMWTLPLRDYDDRVIDLDERAHAVVLYRTIQLHTAAVDVPPAEVAAAINWLDALAALVSVNGEEPHVAPVVDIWWWVRTPAVNAWVSARLGQVEKAPTDSEPNQLDAADLPVLEPLRSRLATAEQLDGWASRTLANATAPVAVPG